MFQVKEYIPICLHGSAVRAVGMKSGLPLSVSMPGHIKDMSLSAKKSLSRH